jgi:hypothetical protein
MLTSFSPPIGAIAMGKSGIGYPVVHIESDRLVLQTPDGLKRVPWSAVIRWEIPQIAKPPSVGDWVQLQNTPTRYLVLTIFEVYAGLDNEPIHEPWAKLEGQDGELAFWKQGQLEGPHD